MPNRNIKDLFSRVLTNDPSAEWEWQSLSQSSNPNKFTNDELEQGFNLIESNKANSVRIRYLEALWIEKGLIYPQNQDLAIQKYKVAFEEGHVQSAFELADIAFSAASNSHGNFNEALQYFDFLEKNEHPDGLNLMGIYYKEHATPKDTKKALTFFEKAANLGSKKGMSSAADYYAEEAKGFSQGSQGSHAYYNSFRTSERYRKKISALLAEESARYSNNNDLMMEHLYEAESHYKNILETSSDPYSIKKLINIYLHPLYQNLQEALKLYFLAKASYYNIDTKVFEHLKTYEESNSSLKNLLAGNSDLQSLYALIYKAKNDGAKIEGLKGTQLVNHTEEALAKLNAFLDNGLKNLTSFTDEEEFKQYFIAFINLNYSGELSGPIVEKIMDISFVPILQTGLAPIHQLIYKINNCDIAAEREWRSKTFRQNFNDEEINLGKQLINANTNSGSPSITYLKALWCQRGIGFKKDINFAIDLYKRAFNGGHVQSAFELAELAFKDNDYDDAVNYFALLEGSKHPEGLNLVAKYYEFGYGSFLNKDLDKALSMYIEAGKLGCTEAFTNAGELCSRKSLDLNFSSAAAKELLEKSLEFYNLAANQNDVNAMVKAGQIYMSKSYTEGVAYKDKAIALYSKAANLDDIQAINTLGKFYADMALGSNISTKEAQDYLSKALTLFLKAVNLGDENALDSVGVIYERQAQIADPIKAEALLAKAKEYYQKAAAKGHCISLIHEAHIYKLQMKSLDANTSEYDALFDKAIALLNQARDNGEDLSAQQEEAELYEQKAAKMQHNSTEVNVLLNQALDIYEKLAKLQNVDTTPFKIKKATILEKKAELLTNTLDSESLLTQSLEIYKALGGEGYLLAKKHEAMMYQKKAEGLPVDSTDAGLLLDKAEELYEESYNWCQDDPNYCYQVAKLYLHPAKQNLTKASSYYEKALFNVKKSKHDSLDTSVHNSIKNFHITNAALKNLIDKNKSLEALYNPIIELETHGKKIGNPKGVILIKHAEELLIMLNSFIADVIKNPPSLKEEVDFKAKFEAKLKSREKDLDKHRQIWKPICANVLLALTGVGLIAILVKASLHYLDTKKPEFSLCKALFFAETTSSKLNAEVVEHSKNCNTAALAVY